MIYNLELLVFFIVGAGLAIRFLPALHPVQLWMLPWAVMTALFTMNLLPYGDLEPLTVVLVSGVTLAFCGFALLGVRIYASVRVWAPPRPMPSSALELAALAALSLTALMLSAFLVQAGAAIGLRDVLLSSGESRRAITDGTAAATITYLYPALTASVLCALAAARVPERRPLWIAGALVAVGSTFFATGRTFTFIALSAACVAFALGMRRPLSKQKLFAGVAAFAVLFLAAFIAIGSLQGKTYESSPSILTVSSVFGDSAVLSHLGLPYLYASAPLAAADLQIEVSSTWGESAGCATVRTACAALSSLGFDAEPASPSMPYTSDPLRWNTYTSLDLPLRDGGTALVIPIFALTGLIVGLAWGACRAGSFPGMVAYPVLAAAILLSTWQNTFASQALWGSIILALLLTWASVFLLPRVRRRAGVLAS